MDRTRTPVSPARLPYPSPLTVSPHCLHECQHQSRSTMSTFYYGGFAWCVHATDRAYHRRSSVVKFQMYVFFKCFLLPQSFPRSLLTILISMPIVRWSISSNYVFFKCFLLPRSFLTILISMPIVRWSFSSNYVFFKCFLLPRSFLAIFISMPTSYGGPFLPTTSIAQIQRIDLVSLGVGGVLTMVKNTPNQTPMN